MARARQQQTVSIDRGLFLIRYAAAEDTTHPPVVRVFPDPTPNKEIGFLLHPDHRETVLWQPDSCLVARALAPGRLTVEVMASVDDGSAAATVRIEPLNQGKPGQSQSAPPCFTGQKEARRSARRSHEPSPPRSRHGHWRQDNQFRRVARGSVGTVAY